MFPVVPAGADQPGGPESPGQRHEAIEATGRGAGRIEIETRHGATR